MIDREELIDKWIKELEATGEQKRKLIIMLSSLDSIELARFFFIADNDHGMSCQRISIKYNVKVGVIKNQIRKARNLIQKLLVIDKAQN